MVGRSVCHNFLKVKLECSYRSTCHILIFLLLFSWFVSTVVLEAPSAVLRTWVMPLPLRKAVFLAAALGWGRIRFIIYALYLFKLSFPST